MTCKHFVHCRRHVDLRQALPALSVVEPHQRAALQRQPHPLTVGHHTGHAAATVRAHLEPVLQRREELYHLLTAVVNPATPPPDLSPHTHPHLSTYLFFQCRRIDNQDSVLRPTPQLSSHGDHFGDGITGCAEN